jgi:hypothetical protein
MEIDLELSELGYFTGTEEYHSLGKMFGDAVVTDGVKYVMDNGYSWAVTDAMSVIKLKLSKELFIALKLRLGESNTAKMILTDGNEKILYEQKYEYTDAKRDLTLFFTNNVLMLSSEY